MKLKRILLIFLLALVLILLGETRSEASLYLDNLDFQVQINDDGSMDVVETWDISISETNTLYKTFIKDDTKYSGLGNVSVKDITDGQSKTFYKASEWEYHLPKDYFFAGTNNKDENEIAWGVSIDGYTHRKYQIKYTVEDAIHSYADCAELYWQFLGDTFEVSADKITGIIKLPASVQKLEDLRVWGHTKYLNGEANIVSHNTVKFNVDNYKSNNYVEIRLTMPTYLFEGLTSKNISNEYKLDDIIAEETAWANEANARRAARDRNMKAIIILVIAGVAAISIFNTIKIFKNKQILKENFKIKPETKLDYFRELPDKTATPLDAVFILNKGYNQMSLSQVFSATILNLILKEHLKVEQEGKNIKMEIKEKTTDDLQEDERKVLDLLNSVSDEKVFTMKDLEKYIKKHPGKLTSLEEDFEDISKNKANSKEKFDKTRAKKGEVFIAKLIGYIFMLLAVLFAVFFGIGFTADIVESKYIDWALLLGLFGIIVTITNIVLISKLIKRFNGFTQKGINEGEQWRAFKKYMEDFSYLNEREVPELVLWEQYLVFATAFGIADRVLKQLKIKYPELNNQDTISNMVLFNAMYNANGLNANFINSISTSTSRMYSSTYSSGSGTGGGFSGGGGFGGRWRRPEAVDNKIYLKKASLSNSPFCTTRIKNIFPKTT